MARRRVRRVLVVAGLGALVAMVVRALRGEPAPQFTGHPSVNGGPAPAPAPTDAPEPVGTPEPQDEAPAPPHDDPPADGPTGDEPAADEGPVAELAAPERELELTASTPPARAASGAQAWADPVDGACPEGYPIKAKLKSGIYHQPGGLAYERTKPDRCYPDAAAAEADGLRPPKR